MIENNQISPHSPFASLRTDFLKAPFVQLFNLAEDPHEDRNLAAQHLDRVSKMVELLQQDIQDGRRVPGPKLTNAKNVVIHQRLPDFVREALK